MSQNLTSQKIAYIDLEMLCWPNGECPANQTKHITQIGLVEIDTISLTVSRTANYYIRPENKNFEVSEYCTNLTKITKELLIKDGRRFPDVMNTIRNEFSPRNKVTFAWGSDNDPIVEHCNLYKCDNPWGSTGIWDLGVIFRSTYAIKPKLTLSKALKYLNVPFEGTPHNALYDAWSLAKLHIEMLRRIRG
jgi:inhibitor of KinA sporulation pathway (predicted exonuclease)